MFGLESQGPNCSSKLLIAHVCIWFESRAINRDISYLGYCCAFSAVLLSCLQSIIWERVIIEVNFGPKLPAYAAVRIS